METAMSKIDELLAEFCPDGLELRELQYRGSRQLVTE